MIAWHKLALVIAAGAHLGLVTASALQKQVHGDGWVARAAREYGVLSGADSYFTFFAPTVDTQLRPVFEIEDSRSGAVSEDLLQKGANAEVALRIGNLTGLLWWEDEATRRALVGAWIEAMRARHPEAGDMALRIEVCDLPSMDEHRQGRRPEWRLLHRDTFPAEARR
jgi:hypothetical protein